MTTAPVLTRPTTKGTPPGPKGHPIVGSLPEFTRDPLHFLSNCAREYGDVVMFRLMNIPVYQVNHPDLIEQIMVTNSRNFRKDITTRRLTGNGLVGSDGEYWLRQRRLMQPAFHRERIAGYGRTMVEYAEEMLTGWQPGEVRNIHKDMMSLTMDIATRTLFGGDVHDQAQQVGASMEIIMEQASFQVDFLRFLLRRLPPNVGPNRRAMQAQQTMDRIVYGLIAQGRQRPTQEKRDDLLSMLLAAQDEDGGRMTDQQLYDEVITLFVAGHETTALALTWAFYLLGQHSEADKRLAAEVREVLQGRPPTIEDLPNLPYTQAVITETMRIYPPAWGVGREAYEAFELGGYQIPAGSQFSIDQWVVHHDPRWFEQPGRFKPERWLDGSLAKRLPRFAYFPFGGGPRQCIGNSFALMEAQLVLAALIQRYRLELLPGQTAELMPAITLRPRHGIKVRLTAR